MRTPSPRRFRLAAFGGLAGLLLVLGAGASALAADDEEDTFEQKVIKKFLGGLGVDVGQGSGIDYRERSPLVIPPSRDLPPPQSAGTVTDPAWPKDPDLQPRQKPSGKPKSANASIERYKLERATASPDELRGTPNAPGSGPVTEPGKEPIDNSSEYGGRALPPDKLGPKSKGLFSWGNLFGTKPEAAPFTGEPDRTSLTQPPAGYQTPSANYPYGLSGGSPNVNNPKAQDLPAIKDRGTQDSGAH